MATSEKAYLTYNKPLVPIAFDLLISSVFLPFGGIKRVREKVIELSAISQNDMVLELGCGTGAFTKLLVDKKVNVTPVDASVAMLKRAKKKLPDIEFSYGLLPDYEVKKKFDIILYSFVLHELVYQDRLKSLIQTKSMLKPGGKILILDHSVPQKRGLSFFWRRFLLSLEPDSVKDCIENGYKKEVKEARLILMNKIEFAGGTVQLLEISVSDIS